MKYEVSISPEVENLILDQALYIARDSVPRAVKWTDEVRTRIRSLAEFPHAGMVSEAHSVAAGRPVRKLTHGNYVVFYTIDDEKKRVETVTFRHTSRGPSVP